MKRLSITQSKGLQDFLRWNEPTIGILSAFQFSNDIWTSSCLPNFFLVPVKVSIAYSECETNPSVDSVIKTAVDAFRNCHRMAISVAMANMSPGVQAIWVQVISYQKREKDPFQTLSVIFDQNGELIETR